MELEQRKQQYEQYVAPTYGRMDLDVESGSEAACRDGQGGRYIDLSSGIGVNALGFGNPQWTQAVKDQLDRLCHISNYFYTGPQGELAQALCERTGMSKVFFANSGAEANECAIKVARKYGADRYGPERHEIVTLANSFHGRTIATLAATGQDGFHQSFGPFPDGFVYAKANDVEDLKSKVGPRTCAIMVELVQGEGGVIPLEEAFVEQIKALCKQQDMLLVVDEIQTGVGRTGRFLCCEHYGLVPDVVTLAKGLGGGLPIGAALLGEKAQHVLGKGDHGSTFGGNPVCCAGGVQVLRALDEAMLAEVRRKGAHIAGRLAGMEGVVSVSGKGMMLGAELASEIQAAAVMAECIRRGVIPLVAKAKLRLLPPLTIPQQELDDALDVIAEVLRELAAQQ